MVLVGAALSCAPDSGSDDTGNDMGNGTGNETSSASMTAGSASMTGGSTDGPPQSCPGQPDVFAPCRTADDCADIGGDFGCVPGGSDPGGGCGGATDCVLDWVPDGGEGCQNDDQCNEPGATDALCRQGEDPCCGPVSACVLQCTPETCAEGDRCPESGICEPVPCDEGFACAPGARCEPGAAGGDAHGCVAIPCDEAGALACPLLHACVDQVCQRAACERDDECECGSCIASQCWERPWECYEPPA